MRREAGAAIFGTVEAFDQNRFVRRLLGQIDPVMRLRVLDQSGLTNAVCIDQILLNEILRRHALGGGDCERCVFNRMADRTPQIDDGEAAFQKRFRLIPMRSRTRCGPDFSV